MVNASEEEREMAWCRIFDLFSSSETAEWYVLQLLAYINT